MKEVNNTSLILMQYFYFPTMQQLLLQQSNYPSFLPLVPFFLEHILKTMNGVDFKPGI